MTDKKCKILSPAGSMEVLKSAVYSGADYVYLSGKKYGARGYAENFSYNKINEAVSFCHEHNVKVFVTVNISILEREITDVLDYIYFLYSQGVDAIIVQDIGLMYLVRELIPDLSIHASTQMTIYDYSFVKWLYDNGVDTVNISREVSIKRIKKISSQLKEFGHDIGLEVFIHGALCYCYSGQCLMSSFLGGRSGNRGLCAQPCRIRYSLMDDLNNVIADNYLLSTKDLCTYPNIKSFLDSGVDCLKIEGRMKSPEYVSATTSVYKKIVEHDESDEDLLLLNLAFNREFSMGYLSECDAPSVMNRKLSGNTGYFIGKVSKVDGKMVVISFANNYPVGIVNGDGLKFSFNDVNQGMYVNHIISQDANSVTLQVEKGTKIEKNSEVYITYSKYLKDKTKEIINSRKINKIDVELEISVNNNMQMQIKAYCSLIGKIIPFTSEEKFEQAINRPTTKENINKQLQKTGNTKYNISKIVYTNYEDNLFLAVSSINKIRRDLLTIINKKINKKQKPSPEKLKEVKRKIENFKKNIPVKQKDNPEEKWNVYINNIEQAEIIKNYPYITSVYYDGNYNYTNPSDYFKNISNDLIKISKLMPEKELIWVLPQILFDEELPHFGENIVKLRYNDVNIKVQTDNIGVAKNLDVESYANNMNIYNNYSIKKLSHDPGFKRIVISPEISLNDIKLLKNDNCELEYNIFGHTQLMISKDNFEDLIKDYENKNYYLSDEHNNKFILKKDYNNNSHIFDQRILNLEDYIDKLRKTNVNNFSIDCRHFNNEETIKIMKHFEKHDNEKLQLENYIFYNGNIEKGVYKRNN